MPINKKPGLHLCATLEVAFVGWLCLSASHMAFAQATPGPLPQGQQGGTVALQPTGPSLVYREPGLPLTIGEVSDMQAAKARAEFLSKFGYTEQKPSYPAAQPARTKAQAQPKPRLSVTALAVWGTGTGIQAEAMVNGQVTTVKGGEMLAPGVKVEQVLPHALVLSVESPASKNSKGHMQAAETRRQTLSIGKASEIDL